MRFGNTMRQLWREAGRLATAAGLSEQLGSRANSVLMFHHVTEDGLGITPTEFRTLLEHLVERFEFVELSEVISGTGRLAVTFDDGYVNFYENARPILNDLGIPSTVFINPDFIGNDAPRRLRLATLKDTHRWRVMSESEITDLVDSEFVTIGNHTRTHHPVYKHRCEELLHEEIVGGRTELEDRFDITVDQFAYPYGEYNELSQEIAETAHEITVTCERRAFPRDGQSLALPRIDAQQPQWMVDWEVSTVADTLLRIGRSPPATSN